jgi:drug/metabolite transporter (DMT)-like permease
LIRFAAVLLGIALGVASLMILAVKLAWLEYLPSYFAQSLAVLTIFTLVIYRYLDRVNDPGTFVQLYLLSMAVKLLAYGAYVVLMIDDDKAGANRNAIFFLILYVVFTAVEVAFLHHKISGKRPQ